jgi:sarcosine dehydrogenase
LTAGEQFGLRLVGLHAADLLRLEKGYRHWGRDITSDDTPFGASLSFAVKLDKGDFICGQALIHQGASGLTRKLVMSTLEDPEPFLYYDEPVCRNGEVVSSITHCASGHKLACAMGMGYLERSKGVSDEWILSGRYEIDVEGIRIPAKVHLKAPYDPSGQRVRI